MKLISIQIFISIITTVCSFQFKAVQISATSLIINTLSSYSIVIQRQYNTVLGPTNWDTQLVPTGSDIIVKFPSDYAVVTGTCSVLLFDLTTISTYNCNIVGKTIQISNAITQDLALSDIKIQIDGVTNPSPALTTGSFIVTVGNDASSPGATATLTLYPATFQNCTIYFDPGFVNTTGKMVVLLTPTNSLGSSSTITIKFPPALQWARDVSTNHIIPIGANLTCTNTTANINTIINCQGQLSTQTITLQNIFSNNINSSFGFSISSLFAPPTTQSADTLVITSYSSGYPIDTCSSKIINLKAQVLNLSITSTSTLLVNSQTGLRFDFTLTDTVTKDDQFMILFPTGTVLNYFTYISNVLSFSNVLSVSNSTNSSLTMIQNPSAANLFAGQSSYFTFLSFVAPPSTRPTSLITFRISLGGYEKMVGTSTITAIAKTYIGTVIVSNTTINLVTSYVVRIQVTDPMTSNGFIVLNVPSQLTLQSNLSITLSGSSTGIKVSPNFQVTGQTITINQLNSTQSNIPAQSINITLSNVRNPQSVQSISPFTFSTYYTSSNVDLIANGNTNTSIVTTTANINPASLKIEASSLITADTNVIYSITLNNTNFIPSQGYIVVQFPSVIGLSSTLSTCVLVVGGISSSIGCIYQIGNKVMLTIPLSITALSMIKISIPNCINPPTTEPTTNFPLTTYTNTNNLIDTLLIGNSKNIFMDSLAGYNGLTLFRISLINSALTTYTFKMKHNQILQSSAIVTIVFPSEVILPSTLTCLNQFNSTISCVLSGNNTLLITLQTSNTVSNHEYWIVISNIKNPQSLQPTVSFIIQTITANKLYKYNRDNSTLNIINLIPSLFASVSYSFTNQILGETNNSLIVNVPLIGSVDHITVGIASSFNFGSVLCSSPSFIALCTLNSYNLIVQNPPNLLPANLSVTLTSLTNPNTIPTDYTTLKSYNKNNFLISQSLNDILLSIKCVLPCRTCSNTTCLSCYRTPVSNQSYLYQGNCIVACPFGTFNRSIDYTCPNCLDPCLTCKDQSTFCVTCNTSSIFIYLNTTSTTSTCLSQCPPKLYPDTTQIPNKCLQCVPPCETCISASICKTCISGYYFDSVAIKCVTLCPNGQSVANNVSKKCDLCATTCATCSGSINNCLTCNSTLLFYNNTCLTQCPSNLVIESNSCVPCDPICLTCYNTSTNCTSCKNTTFYFANTCQSSCKDFYYADALRNCQSCIIANISCKNCSSATTCISCDPGYVLLNQKCYVKAPPGYLNISDVAIPCQDDCETCQITLTNCTSCKSLYLSENACVANCSAGYLGINKLCQPCTFPCQTCTQLLTKCTSCLVGNTTLYLSNFQCLANCQAGTFPNNGSFTCDLCVAPCQTCTTVSDCLSCATGFLSGTHCVDNCSSGYVGLNRTCFLCSSSCKTCSNLRDNCTSCQPSFYYNPSTNTCPIQCPSPLINDNATMLCVSCVSPCLNCVNTTTTCTSCVFGKYLYNYECLDNCSNGYIGINKTCLLCSSPCQTCSNLQTNCTSCQPSFYYNPSTNTCPSQCPSPLIGDNTTMLCISCVSPCLQCVNTTTTCKNCVSGKYLYSSECLNNCPDGYYGLAGICQQCKSSCKVCSSANICFSCVLPFFLYGTDCIQTCPAAYAIIVNNTCTKCLNSLCANCTSNNLCYACYQPAIYYNESCYTSCPNGTQYNGTTCITIQQKANSTLNTTLTSASVSAFPLPFTIVGSAIFATCFMSKLQNKYTYLIGIAYSLFGLLETLSLGYVIYLQLTQQTQSLLIIILFLIGIGIIYFLNIIGLCLQHVLLLNDKKFSEWIDSCENKCGYIVVSTLSLLTNYKFKMIMFTGLFHFLCFRAQLESIQKFRAFNILSFVGLLHQGVILYAAIISLIPLVSIKGTLFFALMDIIIIAGINILLALLVSRKNQNFFDEENQDLNEKHQGIQEQTSHKIPLKDNDQEYYYSNNKPGVMQSRNALQEDQEISLSMSDHREKKLNPPVFQTRTPMNNGNYTQEDTYNPLNKGVMTENMAKSMIELDFMEARNNEDLLGKKDELIYEADQHEEDYQSEQKLKNDLDQQQNYQYESIEKGGQFVYQESMGLQNSPNKPNPSDNFLIKVTPNKVYRNRQQEQEKLRIQQKLIKQEQQLKLRLQEQQRTKNQLQQQRIKQQQQLKKAQLQQQEKQRILQKQKQQALKQQKIQQRKRKLLQKKLQHQKKIQQQNKKKQQQQKQIKQQLQKRRQQYLKKKQQQQKQKQKLIQIQLWEQQRIKRQEQLKNYQLKHNQQDQQQFNNHDYILRMEQGVIFHQEQPIQEIHVFQGQTTSPQVNIEKNNWVKSENPSFLEKYNGRTGENIGKLIDKSIYKTNLQNYNTLPQPIIMAQEKMQKNSKDQDIQKININNINKIEIKSIQNQSQELHHQPSSQKQALQEIIQTVEREKKNIHSHRNPIQQQQKSSTLKSFNEFRQVNLEDNPSKKSQQISLRPATANKSSFYNAGLQQIGPLPKNRKIAGEESQSNYSQKKSKEFNNETILSKKTVSQSNQILDFDRSAKPSEFDIHNQRYVEAANQKHTKNSLPKKPRIMEQSRLKNKKTLMKQEIRGKDQEVNLQSPKYAQDEDLERYYRGERPKSRSRSASKQKSDKRLKQLEKIYLQKLQKK